MTLQDSFGDGLSGAAGTEAARIFVDNNYRRIQGEVFGERYGEGAYIQKFILGRLDTHDVGVSLQHK